MEENKKAVLIPARKEIKNGKKRMFITNSVSGEDKVRV